MSDRLLVVRVGTQRLGLPMTAVVEVTAPGGIQKVPGHSPALRGVIEARGRLVSLFHLGALLAGGTPPAAVSDTVVLAQVDGRWAALEVDEADAAPTGALLPGDGHPGLAAWASGAVRDQRGWIPVLNLGLLAERWGRGKEGAA